MSASLVLTREQSRLVDRIAIDEYGIPGVVLMENAGRGAVETLLEIDPTLTAKSPPAPSPLRGGTGRGSHNAGFPTPLLTPPPTPPHEGEGSRAPVAILCGKGNNAGDGFVIARHLEIRGVASTVLLVCPPGELAGDARRNYDILVRTGGDVVDLSSSAGVDAAALPQLLDRHAGRAAWLVDALLGTGATGPPREPLRTAIAWMNAQPARRLAVDVPSGLDCDSGAPSGEAVRATVTCTFATAKPGLVAPQAAPWVGDLRVVPIGLPDRLLREALGAN